MASVASSGHQSVSADRGAGVTGGVASGALQRIHTMVRTGELPQIGPCPHSGHVANETIVFHVTCRRAPAGGDDAMAHVEKATWSDLFHWFGATASAGQQNGVGTGIETVDIPLRIARDAHAEILQIRSQQQLRTLLRSTPVYAQLLAEFPQSTIEPLQKK